jgi:anti-sigma factor RsiW
MSLSCEQTRALLTPWIDEELAGPDRAAVEAHLAVCGSCGTRAAHEHAAREVVRQRRPALAAERAPESLRARLAAGSSSRAAAGVRSSRRLSLSIAATLLLAVGGLALHALTERSTPLLAAQLAVDHVKCHLMTRDSGTLDPAEVQHRLAEQYGFHARVPPSAPNECLRLVGGRRCVTAEGTNAHILYLVDGRPLSLYLVPDDVRRATTIRVLGRDAVVWSGDNGTYVLVGEHGRGDAERVASYMRRVTAGPVGIPEQGSSIRQ